MERRREDGQDGGPARGLEYRISVSLTGILGTLAVLALAGVLAIPGFFARAEVTLENAAIVLAKDLRSAENAAAFLAQDVVVAFHEHGWRAEDARGRPVHRPGTREVLERNLSRDGVFSGVAVERVDLGLDGVLAIDSRGKPAEGGEVTLRFGRERRRVVIHRGRAEIELPDSTRGWVDGSD